MIFQQKRKLHLGCGRVSLPGFTNVDLFDSVQADLYCDITKLPFRTGEFELIYASHVLEHVHRRMIGATLHHWVELLAPGGVLRLAVPNFKAVVRRYNETNDLEELLGLLYGGQNHPRNNHFIIFDSSTLIKHMERAGLKGMMEWNWRDTEHSTYDDYASCYLPHMQKDTGMLMSLNIEGTKA